MSQNKSKLSTRGVWDVKRHFTLPAMTHERDAQMITAHVCGLPGVRETRADTRRHRVTIVYDITRLYYRQLLEELANTGFPVPDTWWSRMKANWLQGLDETGRDNANAPAAPCCSNPRGIAPARRH